jgi:hypothetical protein
MADRQLTHLRNGLNGIHREAPLIANGNLLSSAAPKEKRVSESTESMFKVLSPAFRRFIVVYAASLRIAIRHEVANQTIAFDTSASW